MSPFDLIDAVGTSKKDVIKAAEEPDVAIRKFNPYITNKHFSYFNDSILHANEMNRLHHLDPFLQYRYYMAVLPARKRFTKWATIPDGDAAAAVADWYGINRRRAREVIKILPKSQIETITKAVMARNEDERSVGPGGNKTKAS